MPPRKRTKAPPEASDYQHKDDTRLNNPPAGLADVKPLGRELVAGKVEEMLVNLVSKARSLGIRFIISMQIPAGRDTRWQVNLTTIVAGALQSGSHDGPALGIDVKEMLYRPSRLTSPQDRPGIFVVRHGSIQTVVQAPFVPMDDFVEVIESLPVVPDPYLVAALSGVENGTERSDLRSAPPERLNATFGLSEATFGSRSRSAERADSGENGHSDELNVNVNANETVMMTPDELAQVTQAVRAYHDGATKEQSITGAFGCRKGGSKAYQRASLLFDLALGKTGA